MEKEVRPTAGSSMSTNSHTSKWVSKNSLSSCRSITLTISHIIVSNGEAHLRGTASGLHQASSKMDKSFLFIFRLRFISSYLYPGRRETGRNYGRRCCNKKQGRSRPSGAQALIARLPLWAPKTMVNPNPRGSHIATC